MLVCCNWTFWAGYVFNPSIGNGTYPDAKLAFDAAGNIYGTAGSGGAYGYGAVFELTPSVDGTYNYISLHDFTGGQDGAGPRSEIVFDTAGNLYGTAQAGMVSGRAAARARATDAASCGRLRRKRQATWLDLISNPERRGAVR